MNLPEIDTYTPSIDNPTCIKCGLHTGCRSPFMQYHGPDNPAIIVVGEAPGEEEDKKGVQFVGRSGNLLRQVLEESGVDMDSVGYTNVVRCRPPDNKITKQAILACRQFAVEDIQYYQPDYVFLMGNTPLNAVLGETGISNWQGSIISKELDGGDKVAKFVPLYHPAFILRDMRELDGWVNAIFTALDKDCDAKKTDDFQIIHPKTWADLLDMRSHLRLADKLIFDFETTSLDAYAEDAKIVAVAFSYGMRSYSYPLYHDEEWWEDDTTADAVWAFTKSILQDHNGNLIGHNVKFDAMWASKHFGFEVNAYGDSMLISHILDSRQGIHGLKPLAGQYCGMYDYDGPLARYIRDHKEANPSRGGNYGNIPLDLLLPYAGLDGKATNILHRVLYDKLDEKQIILYEDLIMGASNVLTRIQCNGFKLDRYIAERYHTIYSALKAEIYGNILEDPMVVKYTKKRMKEARLSLPVGSKRKLKQFYFNPNSHLQRSDLFFNYYHYPVLAKSKKTGLPSTSSKTYRKIEDKHPFLALLRNYKLLDTAISKYLGPAVKGAWLSADGMVHTSYNQHTTRTGRLSSSQPLNLQNIPTPEKEPGTVLEYLPIKNIFTNRDWIDYFGNDVHPDELMGDDYDFGALVSSDYSGMELRVFASLARCEPMLAIHKSGLDFHSMVAIMSIDHKRPDEISRDEVDWFKKNRKEIRYRYKWTNWTRLYGGDAYTLSNLYGIPPDEAQETINMYYDIFPEVLDYKNETQEFAEDHGYIESPFGRREYLPHINDRGAENLQNKDRRAAVNMPVQSGASDILLVAMIILDKKMHEMRLASKLVNTVHDSLVADCPRFEISTYARLCKDVMEHVPEYSKIYLPRLDFSWLLCPLAADVEVGTHYGAEISFKEWQSLYEPEKK